MNTFKQLTDWKMLSSKKTKGRLQRNNPTVAIQVSTTPELWVGGLIKWEEVKLGQTEV